MTSQSRRLERLGLCAILTMHALLVLSYFVPTVGGVDCNGYHVCSRMVEQHNQFHQQPDDELAFVSRMWVRNEAGEFYPKYPPLYPLLAGGLLKVFGGSAGLLVAPLCMILAVLGLYVLCRTFLPVWAALLAAWIGATTPLINAFSGDQVSHGLSICCLTWGYALFFRGTHNREKACAGLLFGSGLLIGYSIGARYPNALMGLPVLMWFLQHRRAIGWQGPTAWLVGGAIPCLFLAIFHWVSFGHPFRTAYSLTEEQGAFALSNLIRHVHFYVPSVVAQGAGPIFWLFLCGYLLTWVRDRQRAWFYTLWMAPLTLLYMSYYWAPQHHPLGYLRFLLPLGIPCVLLAMGFMNELVTALRDERTRRIAIAALVIVQGGWGVFSSLEQLELRFRFNDTKHRRVEFVREHVPTGSTVFGEVELLDDLDYWREHSLYQEMLLHREKVELFVRGTRDSGPDSMQHSRVEAIKSQLLDIDPTAFRQHALRLLDRTLASGDPVYLVGRPETLADFRGSYSDGYQLKQVAELAGGTRRRLFTPALPPTPELLSEYRVAKIVKR